ncbi:hypothetical protein D3C73_1083190 [compost metagenome]
MLNARKTARQGIGTFTLISRLIVIHQAAIEARTADHLALFGRGPGQLAKSTVVMKLRIFLPAVTLSIAVSVGLRIHAAFQLEILP